MRKRSQAREFAIQVLYRMDVTQDPADTCLANFWDFQSEDPVEDSIKIFTEELVKGVSEKLSELDEKISAFAANWQVKRMPVVDRNILRLGSFELIYRADIPPKVSINEAVELAKKYSGEDSGKFINAILDKVKQDMKR